MCVCVCVCEREGERERERWMAMTEITYFLLSVFTYGFQGDVESTTGE